MRVGIISYRMGNLASVARAFEILGHDPSYVTQPAEIRDTTRLILPGVGAFGEAMERICSGGWVEALNAYVARDGAKLLGICLGMQLLAGRGTEHGVAAGLGFIEGSVLHLRDIGVSHRVPHVGGNAVDIERSDPILSGIPDGTDFISCTASPFVSPIPPIAWPPRRTACP